MHHPPSWRAGAPRVGFSQSGAQPLRVVRRRRFIRQRFHQLLGFAAKRA